MFHVAMGLTCSALLTGAISRRSAPLYTGRWTSYGTSSSTSPDALSTTPTTMTASEGQGYGLIPAPISPTTDNSKNLGIRRHRNPVRDVLAVWKSMPAAGPSLRCNNATEVTCSSPTRQPWPATLAVRPDLTAGAGWMCHAGQRGHREG